MSAWSNLFKKAARLGGNVLLSSLMNSNDVKMFGGLKYQPKFFTKTEKEHIQKFFPDVLKNKTRGKINLKFKDSLVKGSDLIYCEIELFKDNELQALRKNYELKSNENSLFLVIQKDTDSNTKFNSKRAPILQFLDNKFKLKLTLRVTTGGFTSIASSKQIGKDLIGKSEFYTLHQAVDVDASGLKKFVNCVNETFTDKKITEKDFINSNTIKVELEHFVSELSSLFDVSESGLSELEKLFKQAKFGSIQSKDIFDMMRKEIILAFKSRGKLNDTKLYGPTKLEILLTQPSIVDFRFTCDNSTKQPQDNRGFQRYCGIVINFRTFRVSGYYIDIGNTEIKINNFSRSENLLKTLSKKIFDNNIIKNEIALNRSFINVLVMVILSSSKEFKDNMQLYF